MSHQPVIDGFEFASAGASQQGALPLGDFPRLADALASDAGEVGYSVKGMRDEQGRPALRVAVRGMLSLRCQRCLEAIGFGVIEAQRIVCGGLGLGGTGGRGRGGGEDAGIRQPDAAGAVGGLVGSGDAHRPATVAGTVRKRNRALGIMRPP